MTEELTKTDYDYILLQYRLERGDELTEDERINATFAKMKFGYDTIDVTENKAISINKINDNNPYDLFVASVYDDNGDILKSAYHFYFKAHGSSNSRSLLFLNNNVVFLSDYYRVDNPLFFEGLCVFKSLNSGLYGAFDKNGKVIIKPLFTKAPRFTDGLAIVSKLSKNNKHTLGVIDRKGKTIIPFNEKYLKITWAKPYIMVYYNYDHKNKIQCRRLYVYDGIKSKKIADSHRNANNIGNRLLSYVYHSY